MKTSLQKHSFRTVGLSLAIGLGLGLAASMHSAQAAIVQITLGADKGFKYSLSGQNTSGTQLDVTLDGTLDSVYFSRDTDFPAVGLWNTLNIEVPENQIAYVYNYGGGDTGCRLIGRHIYV